MQGCSPRQWDLYYFDSSSLVAWTRLAVCREGMEYHPDTFFSWEIELGRSPGYRAGPHPVSFLHLGKSRSHGGRGEAVIHRAQALTSPLWGAFSL